MNTLKIGIFILLAFVSIVTCGWQCGEMGQNQYEYYPYSWISGSSNTGVISSSYTGTLIGTANPEGVETSVYFEWGSVYGWTATTPRSVGNGVYDVTVTETVTSLLPNTTYYYRLAILRQGESTPTYTENQSFTTAGRPSCTTEIPTNVSSLSATLNATVNPNGLPTTVYFQWGLSSSYGINTAEQDIGDGTVNIYVVANISGLSANTTYFFRVVAVNDEGTVYGENRSFATGPPSPIATTSDASSVTYNSAVLNGTVNPNNQDTTVSFQWGPTAGYGNSTSPQVIQAGTSNVSVSANITSLSPTTTYYFRLYAYNPAGSSYGGPQTFTTLAPPPIATTTPGVTNTYNSAVVSAAVNPNGLATTAYFQYGTSTSYGSQTTIQSVGSGITNVNITATITGLLGNTLYYYRVVATNASGQTNGLPQSFTTLVSPPSATTLAATGISASGATLNGSVNPNGGATSVYFDWGTTVAYGNTTTPTSIGSGTGPVAIAQTLTGLTSSTTYYFRVVAVNGTGPTNGLGLQFTTLAQAPTVTTAPPTGVTASNGFTYNATVNPNGGTTTAYFQWGFTSSFGYTSSSQSIGNGNIPISVTQGYTTSSPGTTYYFRIVAYNSGGYSYGLTYTFTTPSVSGSPTVIVTPATNITRTNAQLNGIVNSNGLGTTVYFRYGTTSYYSSYYWYTQSPPLDNGSGSTDFIVYTGAQLLPVLNPNTTYYFQIVATNSAGTTTSGILSFRTLP